MKSKLARFTALLIALAVFLPGVPVAAEDQGDWKSMKQEAKAMKIRETADDALELLLAKNAKAKDLYGMSYGWAVFDNLKLAFGFSGGGGNGVAIAKDTGMHTYMKMGTAGVGLGSASTSIR